METTKNELLDEILRCSPVHKKINNYQYRIRCPICGDSKKDPNDSHCYIKCSYDPTEPILYNCFLCNSNGRVGKWFLEKMGAPKKVIESVMNQRCNRIPSISSTNVEILTGDPIMDSPQVKYIENRIGKGFTCEDYDKFKIVWDMNNIREHITDRKVLNTLPSNHNSISFISDDKSVMMTRTFLSSENDHQWRKIRIIPGDHYSYYIIKATMDIFTSDKIYVNIAEGIFDIISVYRNFNDGPNSVFIAALGSDYISTLNYAISKGFIGSNIIVKVYMDNGINESQLVSNLKKYKWMFDSIYLYKNIIGKDVGEKIEKIKLQEKRI